MHPTINVERITADIFRRLAEKGIDLTSVAGVRRLRDRAAASLIESEETLTEGVVEEVELTEYAPLVGDRRKR